MKSSRSFILTSLPFAVFLFTRPLFADQIPSVEVLCLWFHLQAFDSTSYNSLFLGSVPPWSDLSNTSTGKMLLLVSKNCWTNISCMTKSFKMTRSFPAGLCTSLRPRLCSGLWSSLWSCSPCSGPGNQYCWCAHFDLLYLIINHIWFAGLCSSLWCQLRFHLSPKLWSQLWS